MRKVKITKFLDNGETIVSYMEIGDTKKTTKKSKKEVVDDDNNNQKKK